MKLISRYAAAGFALLLICGSATAGETVSDVVTPPEYRVSHLHPVMRAKTRHDSPPPPGSCMGLEDDSDDPHAEDEGIGTVTRGPLVNENGEVVPLDPANGFSLQ